MRAHKHWLGLAVGAALALPAMSFAAELELYGKAHLSVEHQDDGKDSAVFLSSNSSRLGVKGSADLGSGLTGFAQLESGVDATGEGAANGDGNGGQPNAQGQMFTRARDTFAGIRGAFGAFKVGRLSEGAANAWVYDVNYFADQLGDAANLTSAGAGGRADSTMNYALPAMAGFGLNLSYTPENSTDPDAESSWGANLSFATRELTIAAHAFEFGNTSAVPDHKVAAVSVAYNFGPGSVGAAFVASSDEAGIAGHDRDIWTVGASFKLGGGTLKAQYTSSDEYDDAPDSGATQIALGYDYPLGKNATAYLVYARMDNDDAAAFTPANYGHGKSAGVAANGETPSGLGIGLVYDFAKGW